MDAIEELDDPEVSVVSACEVLGVSRATLYRQTRPPRPATMAVRAPSPRRLGDDERAALLAVLHSEEFGDQPPHEVYATLLTRSIYFASIRTMYRVLAAANENLERRAQRSPIQHAKPTLNATAPNQVWTWDITKLRGPLPGVFYFLYVTIDLFSRMVVGWMLAERENAAHAEQLFADTVSRHDIAPGALIIHADRGSPMRSDGLAQLLAGLGVARSFSRPHVSDDNAFSEAQFKTLKYQPDYPGAFGSPLHARAWCQEFFAWFNDIHQHSGIALFAPADVFYGRVDDVVARRQLALDGAYAEHPERFPNGPPVARRPPAVVSINPLPVFDDDTIGPLPAVQGEVVARDQHAHVARARTKRAPHAAAKTPRHDALATAGDTANPNASPSKERAPHAAAKTPRHDALAAALMPMTS